MGNMTTIAPGAPLASLAAFLLAYPREQLEALTEALIAAQDVRDGDPDSEPDGDEMDVSVTAFDERDPVYRLAEHKDASFHLDHSEDEEDGDPLEFDGDERDGTVAEDDFVVHAWSGPGCPVGDPDGCLAADDTGTTARFSDGRPGDDADAEPNGDESDGNNAEDEVLIGCGLEYGAGCPIADPGGTDG